MATTQDIHAPTLGTQGEPCASCGAPLAADQRYCLECGARRAEARLPFRDILATGAPPPVAAAAPEHEEPPPARTGVAFLVGLLCLLAALGVGVLIGNSGNDKTAATPPPQVITVGGAAAAPAATTPAATTSTTGSSSTSSGASGSSSKSGKDSSASSSSKRPTGSAASKKAVKDLNSSSGADYQKKSQKLPKQVGTSGKAPPKDNKPAGGGTGFQDIG